jgi:phosphoglycolate phosphatase-like HAD superfamily hydrolase
MVRNNEVITTTKNIAAIFLDLGDTILDEQTEMKDASGTTLSAELVPGMAEALRWLHAQGYRLALVADSRPETPMNVLRQHNLLDLFECLSVSESVGVEKPGEGIFLLALQTMQIPVEDYPHVLMVGNNLERDIVGANRLGLRSVFFHAYDRRRTIPRSRSEFPRHTVTTAGELLKLIGFLSVTVDGSQPPMDWGKTSELALASRFTPWIWFDEAEPFFPSVVGYTIFKREELSPSFLRPIQQDWRPAWTTAIEYALWWDWDIGHLYELEHVWSYLDETENLVWVEASSHGSYASMLLEDRTIPRQDTHPVVYAQPGKHAFSPTPLWFELFHDMVFAETSTRAGHGGVLVKDQYTRQIPKNPEVDALVAGWLRQKAFIPTMKFNRLFQVTPELLIPWPVLDSWIPQRVNWWIDHLRL